MAYINQEFQPISGQCMAIYGAMSAGSFDFGERHVDFGELTL